MAADEATTPFMEVLSEAKPLTPPTGAADVLGWLAGREDGEEAARDAGLLWLLATTHGAVVWGRKDGERWALSAGDSLPAESLLDLRAFGPDGEVFVWRGEGGLRARRRTDGRGDKGHALPEEQLLWGTQPDQDGEARPGFFPLRDGDQGLRHAPPLVLDDSYFVSDENDKERFGHRPARLRLRHYIGQDEATGVARIVDTRLVEVWAKKP